MPTAIKIVCGLVGFIGGAVWTGLGVIGQVQTAVTMFKWFESHGIKPWLPPCVLLVVGVGLLWWAIRDLKAGSKIAHPEISPSTGALEVGESDPRVYLEPVNSEFIATGNIPFKLFNKGGSVAHNVNVGEKTIDGRRVSFTHLAHLDVNTPYRFLPEVEAGIMQHHDITAPLMKEWDKAGKLTPEFPLELSITYEDFAGKRKFKSSVSLVYHPVREIATRRTLVPSGQREPVEILKIEKTEFERIS